MMRFTATGNYADSRTTPPSSVEFPVNRFTGNSAELGGVVCKSFVRSAWFPVAVNRIMECTPLHGSQLSQSDAVELVLPETQLNERTNERTIRERLLGELISRKLGHRNESLNPPLLVMANNYIIYNYISCKHNGGC